MLLDLPGELLILICDYLTLEDWKNISYTHSRLNSLVQSHLYSSIVCEWSGIPELYQMAFARHIRHLSIKGHGEWKYSIQLSDFVELCPQFTTISMESSSSSSGWLKYIGPPALLIRNLNLTCTNLYKLHLFDFDHILNMPQLIKVKLTNFQIITPELPHRTIEDVELLNCTWDYPDDPSAIGALRQLSITLNTALHPFSFSERLQHIANYPPPKLEVLKIHLDIGHRVGWKPLRRGSKSVKKLSLRGFEPAIYKELPNLVEFDQGYNT